MKFVHCGDIHLDSPFVGAGIAQGEKLRADMRNTFSALVTEAMDFGADMLLIAGDLYEEAYVTKETMLFVSQELSRFGKKVFITPGNHDPYRKGCPYSTVSLPENVTVFKSRELTCEDVGVGGGVVRVYGHAYDCENPSYYPLDGVEIRRQAEINAQILVSHAELDGVLSPYAVVTSERLSRLPFDYTALGHIHAHSGIKRMGVNTVCYSGSLVGRDFGECGIKGAVFGEITSDGKNVAVKCEFRRLCQRRFEISTVNITNAHSPTELYKTVSQACSQYGRDTILRIVLEGTKHTSLSGVALPEALAPFAGEATLADVKDETTPHFDIDELERDRGIRGEFYRQLKPLLAGDDPEKRKIAAKALGYGLEAFKTVSKK